MFLQNARGKVQNGYLLMFCHIICRQLLTNFPLKFSKGSTAGQGHCPTLFSKIVGRMHLNLSKNTRNSPKQLFLRVSPTVFLHQYFFFKNNQMDGQDVTQTISNFQTRKEMLQFPDIYLTSTLPLLLKNGYPRITWQILSFSEKILFIEVHFRRDHLMLYNGTVFMQVPTDTRFESNLH